MSTDSSFPSYHSSEVSAGAPSPMRPRSVSVAFWLYLLAGALEIVVVIIGIAASLGARQRVHAELIKTGAATGRHIDVSTVIGIGIGVSVVFGVIALAAFLVFAILMRRGYGWARIVLLIITVLALIGVTGADGIGALKAIVAIAATVLVFLPASSAWFGATKASRRA